MAWGWNNHGQCEVPSPNPDFVAIAGGEYHSLGLKEDGSIVAWGWNDYGQCDVPAPNTGFVAADGAGYHSLGLKSDGTIVAWGRNYEGQCNVPVPNADFVAITGAGNLSLGLKSPSATGIERPGTGQVPAAAKLRILSLMPNPFNPATEVWFETQRPGPVTMEIYDVNGRRVRTVPLGFAGPGRYWAQWDGRDASGDNVASGVYFVRLRGAKGESQAVKAVVVR